MLEAANKTISVPQVFLELKIRGNPPALDQITFTNAHGLRDSACRLQRRALTRAVAVVLVMFRAHPKATFFRIAAKGRKPSLVHVILNAKDEPLTKTALRGLAGGMFLQLFQKPTKEGDFYLDLDVSQLKSEAIIINVEGITVTDARKLKDIARKIAADGNWELADYPIKVVAEADNDTNRVASDGLTTCDNEKAVLDCVKQLNADQRRELDNPCLAAIREALRHFRPDFAAQHLRVGLIRSPAELETLWNIDNEAYGDASITFETFRNWWLAFPLGLRVLFFENRIMGAIGIWPISGHWAMELKEARAKEAQLPSNEMRELSNATVSTWYISGIVLRPELVGSRAIKILLSKGLSSWLSAVRIGFPCELLALAYSSAGQALLEGFSFFPVQSAASMPDKAPLFGLDIESRKELVSLLHSRGIDFDR